MRHSVAAIVKTKVESYFCYKSEMIVFAVSEKPNIYQFDKKVVQIAKSQVECIRLSEDESSPSRFYIILKSDEAIRSKIDDRIKKGTVPLDRYESGTACLSIYEDLWYRAVIVKVYSNTHVVI